MIFEYDDIIEDIFKRRNNLDVISKKSKKFKEFKKNKLNDKFSFVNKYTKGSFKEGYVKNICQDKRNKILSYCLDSVLNYENVPTIIISRKVFKTKDKVRYVLLLIVTQTDYRSLGYGNAAISDYFNYILDTKRKVEIILHSLVESENFYLKLGFEKISKSLFLERLEGFNNDKDDNNNKDKEIILLKYTL